MKLIGKKIVPLQNNKLKDETTNSTLYRIEMASEH